MRVLWRYKPLSCRAGYQPHQHLPAISRLGDVLAKEHYLTLEKTASDCLQCGHCNSRCPFSVDQMARMEEIQKYFGR